MICPNCSYTNEAEARFCVNCGRPLGLTCPSCGNPVQRGQNFCSNCGHNLRTGEGSTAVAPVRYTPHHLAERILTERHAVIGERKQVTVMFADIVDSTAAIQGADPEEAAAYLTTALEAMMDSIHGYEGTVNELRGDGLMALFGAPLAHEDHAVRAARAALDIPGAVAAATDGTSETRVGLHTGEVLVRGVGNDLSVEYQALGPTVHLAARMESLAEPGQTYVTRDVCTLIEGQIDSRPVGRMAIKGITDPVEVFELVGAAPASPWEARSKRGLTEFTGRTEELQWLGSALSRATDGTGRSVALRGEAGVGKSRLVHELIESLDRERYNVLKAEASPFEANTAYYPIKVLTQGWMRGNAPDNIDLAAVRMALVTIDPELEGRAPAFAALAGVQEGLEGWDSLSPQERKRATRDAITATLAAMATHKPLLVVIEDLHWIDSETGGVIEEIISMTPSLPLLTLVTYRPEFTATWESTSHVEVNHIEALDETTSLALLDSLMGTDASLSLVKEMVASRAEGTPLFIEETVRTLRDEGALVGDPGAYRAALSTSEVHIPESVTAVLAARIDRLGFADKRAMQVAAVVGEVFQADLVAEILDVPQDQIRGSLRRLHTKEFFVQDRAMPPEFRFAHALVRDVAYQALPLSERRTLHAQTTSILETSQGGSVERLAYHSSRGELWHQAAKYASAAADKSIRASAFREASQFLRDEIEALENLPTSTELTQDSIDARMQLRVAETGAQGGLSRLVADLDAAGHLADSIGDRTRRGRVAIHAGYTANMLGATELAEQHAGLAHQIGMEIEDEYLTAESQLLLAQSHIYSGRIKPTVEILSPYIDYLTKKIRFATMDQTMIRSVVACSHLAVAEAASQHLDQAMVWIDDGMAISDEAARPFDRMYIQFALGKCLDLQGDPEAYKAHDLSAEIANNNDLWFMMTFAQPWRAHAHLRAGHPQRALEILERTEAEARLYELPFVVAESQAFRSVVAASTGADPTLDAQRAIEFGESMLDPHLVMLGKAALGDLPTAAGIADDLGFAGWADEMRAGLWERK